jgi:hypothetical protein
MSAAAGRGKARPSDCVDRLRPDDIMAVRAGDVTPDRRVIDRPRSRSFAVTF